MNSIHPAAKIPLFDTFSTDAMWTGDWMAENRDNQREIERLVITGLPQKPRNEADSAV